MNIKEIFGENLKKYRKILNLSQEELSEKLGISVNHLSNIEVGKKFISSELLERIYEIMHVTPSALFYSSEYDGIDDNKISIMMKLVDKKVKEMKEEIRRGI